MFVKSTGILRNMDEGGAGDANPAPSPDSGSAPTGGDADGGASDQPFEFNSVEEAFDKVANHYESNWEDPRPDHNEVEDPFGDDDDESGQNDDDEMDGDP